MKFIQYPDQIDLAKICRNIENKTLILDPDFQRDYVWTKEDASKLIESFLLDIPVPQIFLHWNKDDKRTVIDGKQRLISVHRFIQEQKWNGEPFKLILEDKDPENSRKKTYRPWHNKTFDELTKQEQDKLYDTTISVINLRGDDEDMIFSIFERLNTSGSPLNPIQIIHSIYPKIGKTIKKISQSPEFNNFSNEFLDFDDKDKKEWEDLGFILKIFALSSNYKTYKAPLIKFQKSFSEQNKDNTDLLQNLSNKFLNVIQDVEFIKYLKEMPSNYRKKTIQKIKPSIIETILSLLVAQTVKQCPDYSAFDASCFTEKQGTASTKTITERFDRVLSYAGKK